MKLAPAHHLLVRALQDRQFGGAVLLVEHGGEIVFHKPYGTLGDAGAPQVEESTLFDLASLTKVLATTPCWMLLAAGDTEILDRPISHWFFDVPRYKTNITPRHLLAHASGLPAWRPYYLMQFSGDRLAATCERILTEPLEYPVGGGCVYSDLGFILLGCIVEIETGSSLDRFCAERIFSPLDLDHDLMFKPTGVAERIAVTRVGEPAGLVNDLNARSLGGVAGHAGLFGTARAVAGLAATIVKSRVGKDGFFSAHVVREFCERIDFVSGCTRALGFDTPSEEGSSSGRFFSHRSIGHTGFTGTSVWIDLDREVTVVLLTNRVIMGEADRRIKEFRPLLHDAIMETLFC